MLRRSARRHGWLPPFWLGLLGAVAAVAGLALFVTGVLPAARWAAYVGLGVVVVAAVADVVGHASFFRPRPT